jgi:fatty-acyl-CoA synthase
MVTFDWPAKQAGLRPDKIALIDATTERRFTYADLDQRTGRLAEFLRDEWGVQPGNRVALLAHSSPETFEALWACARLGAILVLLNWRLALSELTFIWQDSDPVGLIYDTAFATTAAGLKGNVNLERTLSLDSGGGPGEYEKALAQASGRPLTMAPRPLDDVWHILYTAGTTGRPKGVLQTFAMVFYNAVNSMLAIDLTGNDVTLNLLPTFHTGGLNLYTHPTLHAGGTAVIQRAFDPDLTLRLLAKETTAFFAVPAIYLALSQQPTFESADFKRMRVWGCGGAPMPHSLLQRYAQRGILIRQGFGMTETGPTVFMMDEAQVRGKVGSVGRPQLHVDVRIVDGDGRDLPPGSPGELLIKGPGITPGYWRLPDVTAATIVDGWLHSGDVAVCDGDGYYTIVDRRKDMFISGGENVYPAEVENVIYQMPEVAEAAVIGIPDPKWGEVGRAVVVLKPDQALTEGAVIAFCRTNLAHYKAPKTVVFAEQLPRNAAGKVLKKELREKYGP